MIPSWGYFRLGTVPQMVSNKAMAWILHVKRRPYPANPCDAGTSVDIVKRLTMTVCFLIEWFAQLRHCPIDLGPAYMLTRVVGWGVFSISVKQLSIMLRWHEHANALK